MCQMSRMKKRLKINGIIMICVTIMIAFFPRVFIRFEQTGFWEDAIEILGFALIFLGQIIRVSARGYKAEHSGQSQTLIQAGPYQIVRNPMYLGIFLIGLGAVLAMFKWWAVVIFVLVFIFRYMILIDKEEKKLMQLFPQEYQDYCRRVPRIFPSLSSIIRLDINQYLPMKLAWFKKEIGSILGLLLFTLLIESWEDIIREGFKTYLWQSVWLLMTFILFVALIILLSKLTNEKNGNGANKS